MHLLTYILYFLIFMSGASFASFLSVLHERGSVSGRSVCTSCLRTLNFYELVPIFSFLILRGACRTCKKIISPVLFLGELGLGVWFLASYSYFSQLQHGFFLFALSLVLGCIFFLLVLEDVQEMQVSTTYLYLLLFVGVAGGLLFIKPVWILASIIIFSPFWIIYFINKNWIGQADPFVYTSLGIFFGPQFSISLFLYSIWIGAIFGVLYLFLVHKKLERGVRLPLLPIIFFSTLIILIFNFHIVQLNDILFLYESLYAH